MADSISRSYGAGDRLRGLLAAALANVVLGIAAVVVPLVAAPADAGYYWNNIVTGLLIVGVAAFQAWAAYSDDRVPSAWVSGLNVLLGLWLAASPFVYEVAFALVTADVVIGVAVAILAGFGAMMAATGARRARSIERSGF